MIPVTHCVKMRQAHTCISAFGRKMHPTTCIWPQASLARVSLPPVLISTLIISWIVSYFHVNYTG